ncbi:hypothetical protein Ppa06_67310 [Planomonospora parontospora subsp. parontospora]|uniref:Uncharacterized protein n=2 Tax=Planomonospora parontospora TaxID=58119 RepID=A0AA37F8L8_9ACTN|nr:hypothetical protein [Planomonospora parontospora]GGK99411.1 hypothetical protein GCM10010126_68760 [Planomonospora parontospora]GII12933.1 hypothetical protein Ppa06_67310 [Planomonospora parontospora subsp. parontospora]
MLQIYEEERNDRVKQPEDKEEGDQEMVTAPPTEAAADPIVQINTRVRASFRRRVRMAAAAQDINVETLINRALEEYMDKRDL